MYMYNFDYNTMKTTYIPGDEANYLKEIGQKISLIRKELGLTQTELANKIDAQQQQIASYEIGRRRIPIYTLKKIADSLHVNIDELLPVDVKPIKRGPSPKAAQYMEKIQLLSESKQKAIFQSLDLMLEK